MKDEDEFPRIRDLREREREPFRKWLAHCTRPWTPGGPREEQEWYYECDYRAWKRGLPAPLDDCDLVTSPVDDLRQQLRLVLSTENAVDEWLDAPDPSLGDLPPREVASQPGGLQRVQDLVTRMIHGVP